MRARVVSMLVGTAIMWSAAAHAQEKRDPVAADYLFREARKAARAGDYRKACPLFADSLKLDPGAGVLMNLADCEEHTGQIASAWEHWREALDTLRGKNDKRIALAKRKIAALEKRLPRLTLRLDAGSPDGATVERDGAPLGASALGLPVPVNPGDHVVVVHAPKHQDRSYTVSILEAQSLERSVGAGVELPDKPATGLATTTTTTSTTDPPLQPPPPDSSATRTIGIAVLGVGALGVGVGIVTGLVAIDKKNTVQQNCQSDPAGGVACRDQTGLDAASAGRTMSTVSTVAFAVGALGIGVGAVLLVTSGNKGSTSTAISPRVMPGGGGLLFARTF